ncbi:bifunctional riboflavin kinase/FAD synthetase [Frankia sp. CNm7]|uniref:Riboflavin biosynthesis protein n=1 Tax=Frankia nepalensis TaxID=1836974 RepID=A0A937RGU7_9ACTN|nr:bifunctional riboflavin kinase/FAD synthetase [Frankia nepalensis]MBL7501302.1 bifunctional riboflavin kinase/FAD synthetase [Frankia nepalensis]MBL7515913.1 bifunctional riboflavin kinase/FAD synthetase [Frankia nepalensis]MBL7519405.1 bifunctional riboflavin kinase/FAD synthetase [Frankia nepalensis]MBL7628624.1 bifunctional riboflavin kinase/FAD synthetase [Frankia nepalensis]
MRWWRGLDNTPDDWRGGVVTIGFFDGVHLGHRKIIGLAVERAKELGVPSLVLTFDPHPAEVVRPGSHPALLTTLEFKAELLEAIGVDALCVQPFTLEFSEVTADEFAAKILAETLRAQVVVIGENFTYGHRAAGKIDTLVRSGAELGFKVEGVSLLHEDEPETPVLSSTHIRAQVVEGDVAGAAHGLGRLHRVEGVVVHGDARGRTIGYPTANLQETPWAAVPADGVYAGFACWRGRRQPAAISIGTNPTFAGRERRVEAYLLDFDGDLYGEYMAFEFVAQLRPTLKFDSVEALVSQMALDVEATRTATTSV